MRDEKSPSPSAEKIPLKSRVAMGLTIWVVTSFAAWVRFANDIVWQAVAVVVCGGLSAFMAYFAKSGLKVEEEVPAVALESVMAAQLVQSAAERADRAAIAWLTVAGAVHSVMIVGLIGFKQTPVLSTLGANASLLGGGLLAIGLVCFFGGRFVHATRGQLVRALKVARASASSGAYYNFVYFREEESWQWGPGSLLIALGNAWLMLGLFFVLLGILLTAL